MRKYVHNASLYKRMERLAALSIAMVGAFSQAAHGQSSPSSGATSTPESVLPHGFVVSLSVVEEFFPEVTKEASTGQNSTAVGNPKTTRSVIYANTTDASSAYEQAVEKSKIPGFKPVSVPNLGQKAFAGDGDLGRGDARGLGFAGLQAHCRSDAGGLRRNASKHN